MMKPPKSQAKMRIQRVLDEIPRLKQFDADSQEFKKWQRDAEIAISNTFGDDTKHVKDFIGIRYTPIVWSFGASQENAANARASYVDGLDTAEAILRSMVDEIEEFWPEEVSAPSAPVSPTAEGTQNSKQVFVVGGRDEGTTETVARFLDTLELEPVILREQSNEGRTIIEKFEDYAQVPFAVVLCTPDDVGALATEQHELQPRPRQNVVLELGFFMGKIGRQRVCALLKGDVEIPSDYSGVLYIRMDDAQGWQLQLARELHRAGLPVDANKIL